MAIWSIGVLPIPTLAKPTISSLTSNSNSSSSRAVDAVFIKRAAELADKSAGFSAPHPNFGCVIATAANDGGSGVVVGEGYLYAEGTKSAELQAVEAAGDDNCKGATAFLNMEPGDCYSDRTAVSALVNAGITRVVVGIRHPLKHLRGNAIRALRSEGLQVDVLREYMNSKSEEVLHVMVYDPKPQLKRGRNRSTIYSSF